MSKSGKRSIPLVRAAADMIGTDVSKSDETALFSLRLCPRLDIIIYKFIKGELV